MAITGRCLCGSITYRIDGDLGAAGICHCKNCQRQAGSAFSTLAAVPKADLAITGEPKLYEDSDTATGNTVGRYFCGNCGSPIYSAVAAMPDTLFLKTGTLDDTSGFKPGFHSWQESKQAWVEVAEGGS